MDARHFIAHDERIEDESIEEWWFAIPVVKVENSGFRPFLLPISSGISIFLKIKANFAKSKQGEGRGRWY